MKRSVRILVLLLATVLLCGMLVSCVPLVDSVKVETALLEAGYTVSFAGDDIIGAYMSEGIDLDEKIIAIPVKDPNLNSYNDITELPKHQFEEIKHFFEVYKYLENKTTRVDKIEGREAAVEAIKKCKKAYKEKFLG